MDANNPYGQYDFIMSHSQKQPKSLLPTGNTPKQRLMIVGLLAAVLLVVGIVIVMILSAASRGATGAMLSIAQKQQELIRISAIASSNARSPSTAAFAGNIALSTNTAQQRAISYLSANGVRTNSKNLSVAKNSQHDRDLTSALSNGDFDKTFDAMAIKLINEYRAAVIKEYNSSKNTTEKSTLKPFYDATTLLLKQAEATVQ